MAEGTLPLKESKQGAEAVRLFDLDEMGNPKKRWQNHSGEG